MGTFFVLGSWLIDASINGFSFGYKFKKFLSNRPLVYLATIFFLHVIGLLYTTNFDYALNDLRTKLPFLALPIFFAGAPNLKQSGAHWLMKIFILAMCLSTLISFYKIVRLDLTDLRDAMVFTSHIRMGLMMALALCYMAFTFLKQRAFWRFAYILISFWLLFFMYKAQITTGLVVLFFTAVILSIVWSFKNWKSGFSKLVLLGMLGMSCAASLYVLALHSKYFTPKEELSELPDFTANGEKYIHLKERTFKENGFYTDVNFAPIELEETWNLKSEIGFKGRDKRGQRIESTVKRYMTSKGLKKDRVGVDALSDRDIENIESGMTNCNENDWNPIERRLNELFYEYTAFENESNPSGNSLLMRTEFWRAGWGVFLKNKIIGTGTGDIKDKLNVEYKINGTLLNENYRYRIHNQYLTIAASFGICGFLIFLFCFFYPYLVNEKSLFFSAFIIISALSFLTEDTLETQVGATFVAFFYCFFLVIWPKKTT